MTAVAVERIKLAGTAGPWWALGAATVAVLGIAAVVGSGAGDAGSVPVPDVAAGTGLGALVVMVLAAVSVTAEHRYGTLRATFLTQPRPAVVLGKAALFGGLGTALGLAHAAGAYLLVAALPATPAPLDDLDRWRELVGIGPYYGLSAVIAVAVAFLLRGSAAVVPGLLLWVFAVEPLVGLAGDVGAAVQDWMPFLALSHAVGQGGADLPYGPWVALVYATALTAVLLGAAVAAVIRRDA